MLTVALVLVAACALAVGALWLQGRMLPAWVRWAAVDQAIDLDGDGAAEHMTLRGGVLNLTASDGVRVPLPAQWRVSDAFVGDVTHDGRSELVLLVWKQGSYGQYRPFWVERNDTNWGQHIFIYDYANGELQPVWMSSAIGFEVRDAYLDERGRVHVIHDDGSESIWEWQTWGLVLVEDDDAGQVDAAGPAKGAPVDGLDLHIVEPRSQQGSAADGESASRVTLIAVGDNIAHEGIYQQALKQDAGTFDFSPVYETLNDRMAGYDIAVVNQETPFVHDPSLRGDYPRFGTPESMGAALVDAGFNVVCAATNHVNDRGQTGIVDTLSFWSARYPQEVVLGLHGSQEDADALDCVQGGEVRIGMLNATFSLNGLALPDDMEYQVDEIGDGEQLAVRVAEAESRADITVCFLHIGEEYSDEPTAEQRQWVERLVDAGADVVICTHPHVVQPAEELTTAAGARGVVFWSLGNFATNQTRVDAMLGGAASLVIEKDGSGVHVASWDLLPMMCHVEPGMTREYFLDDYTDELAARHALGTTESPLSLDALWQLWRQRTGR